MEAFSLLKYWRGGGGGAVNLDGSTANNVRTTSGGTSAAILTAVSHHATESEQEDGDEGPFFDLEFTLPDNEEEEEEEDDGSEDGDERLKRGRNGGIDFSEESDGNEDDGVESGGSGDESERDFKFTLSSGSNGDPLDSNASLSPTSDLFFKGRLVPVESSSLVYNGSDSLSKSQFPVSLLKSATKFRVLMLKFKKSKSNASEKTEHDGSATATPKLQKKQLSQNHPESHSQTHRKLLTVKLKVEEVPILSIFTRDNSSRAANNKAQKQNSEDSASDEKKFSKDVMQRYLKMVKPLYVRVSKRYGDKMRFSGQFITPAGAKSGPSPPSTAVEKLPTGKSTMKSEMETGAMEVEMAPQINVKSQKQGNLPAGLRVVCKHLGKSRSASSAVATSPAAPVVSKRRDDSLLQQQDGIQSAILHCKRSFNASRDLETNVLSRSSSDPSHDKSLSLSPNKSPTEAKAASS